MKKKNRIFTCNQETSDIHTRNNAKIKIQIVRKLKYLGFWIDNSPKDIQTRKVQTRVALTNWTIWKSNLKRGIKIRLFIRTVESVLLYGYETYGYEP